MSAVHEAPITSAEIAALWTQYMSDSAGLCFNKHMLSHIEDPEIKAVFEYAMSLGSQNLEQIKNFFRKEGYPVPIGFTDDDWVPKAPRLFSDTLCLHYLNIMSIHASHAYSGAVTTCSRQDVRAYYTQCTAATLELCNRTKNVLLAKGLYYRPPIIQPPERPEFIQNDSFLAGWLGAKRPLNCIEISDIYFNLKKSILAKAITVAFSQVAASKKVRDFFLNALQVKGRHIQVFNDVLNADNLPAPPTFDAEITDSTTAPFSEKLMMFQIGFLFSTAMVYYSAGWASSLRRDLAPKYVNSITEDLKIGSDWIDIMIENRWFEQPPLAEDRKALATQKS